LTSYSEYSIVRQMLENGASGYVIKNAMPEEILLGIQTVADNETFL
ncbi:MAG TPA: DNA-binding response regulator, partial [Porphyromonadaceae bacterium]|nr:DNA-binding response regulator [Porphyromonadaceae bacterium]